MVCTSTLPFRGKSGEGWQHWRAGRCIEMLLRELGCTTRTRQEGAHVGLRGRRARKAYTWLGQCVTHSTV